MIKDGIEWLPDIDDVGVRNEDIAYEQLFFRRQSEAGIERPLEVAVCQDTEQRVAVLHREMTDVVIDHEDPGRQHTLVDLHHVRKWCHERTDRRDMVYEQRRTPQCWCVCMIPSPDSVKSPHPPINRLRSARS